MIKTKAVIRKIDAWIDTIGDDLSWYTKVGVVIGAFVIACMLRWLLW